MSKLLLIIDIAGLPAFVFRAENDPPILSQRNRFSLPTAQRLSSTRFSVFSGIPIAPLLGPEYQT